MQSHECSRKDKHVAYWFLEAGLEGTDQTSWSWWLKQYVSKIFPKKPAAKSPRRVKPGGSSSRSRSQSRSRSRSRSWSGSGSGSGSRSRS